MSACPPCEICGHCHFPRDPCWLCPEDHVCRRERPDAAPPEEVRLDEYDIRRLVPQSLEYAITTPHDHEHPSRPPLWLIWVVEIARTGVPFFPVLDSVCDTEKSARYHIGAAIETAGKGAEVYVERIPANHRFGSSLGDLQMKTHMAMWKSRRELDGD